MNLKELTSQLDTLAKKNNLPPLQHRTGLTDSGGIKKWNFRSYHSPEVNFIQGEGDTLEDAVLDAANSIPATVRMLRLVE